jgi:peptidoglycan/xylan/chitin deacetylase (PgdA/CDA1 family)
MSGVASLRATVRPDPGDIDPRVYQLERYVDTPKARPALRAYYAVKPWLPRAAQLQLRRLYARRQARRDFPAWPVEPLLVDHFHAHQRAALAASGRERLPIVNFWPEGRRFAAVLTHDVEGPAGVANIPRVLEIEARHGMVSSWNFVAEWYAIPDGTFDRIRDAGGEIGLHGIKHDGRLFTDRAVFDATLPLIHRYLREWDAVGFRSPATHRNADWMPDLGCLYDSSFPDTDPFEPQPGGCCSIFPFLLGDLVELPITLVQDHTMWEILQRDSIDLWVRKSDWIARNHGLINLIVHPDYVVRPDRLDLYDRYLGYLRALVDDHAGWHVLPRDVARWWKRRAELTVDDRDGVPEIVPATSERPKPSVAWVRDDSGRLVIDVP